MSEHLPFPHTDEPFRLSYLKAALEHFTQQQIVQFEHNHSVSELIHARSDWFDELLTRLFTQFELNKINSLALIAVGGYGRRELHPLSDIDILLTFTNTPSTNELNQISDFITFLWDLKIEIGHALRSIDECITIGKEDLTVATNLQEARLIDGDQNSFDQLSERVNSGTFWPSHLFYQAKVKEQSDRHAKFFDTSYNLEPDIKSTPGGLRDIHTLKWIARRHFGATSLLEMSHHGFLTDSEYRELLACQDFLWQVRFALHCQLKRYDNRLTFEHQAEVAALLGFVGDGNKAVETMMKAFYRNLRRVVDLNKMLLKIFDHVILDNGKTIEAVILSEDFQRSGRLIEARKPALFQARPETILDMLLHIANDPSIESVGPETSRQLRTAMRRFTRFLHMVKPAREKFITLCRHPNALNRALPLMHKLGILATYLPQWSQIVGQMQFDLFHVYTVDEHSMRLLQKMHAFSDRANLKTHPICCEIYPKIAKKELLILAAIFHDIAKGRGGDHSELGAIDAYDFCIEHQLSKPEAKLVAWLVKNHLLMSVTAQRRDIYDPDVIKDFAANVRDEEYLNYLMCLTVADICATNPALWNNWKGTLLSDLFSATQRGLRRGLENPIDVREKIRHNQQLAMARLIKQGFEQANIQALWQRFKADYFLRHTHKQIAWQSAGILSAKKSEQGEAQTPLILISKKPTRGGTEVFVYCKDHCGLFARVVEELDRRHFNIHDAQILTSKDGYSFDTFMVLDDKHQPIAIDRHQEMVTQLQSALSAPMSFTVNSGHKKHRWPRQLKHFSVRTAIDFLPTKGKKKTLVEVVALDTPGLLATIAACFAQSGINLHAAKITTIGERAEDFFIITDNNGQQLTDEAKALLKTDLTEQIKLLEPS